jgi:hypothetical protein
MLSRLQVKKMDTPRELYLECLDDNLRKTPIPRICYKISMDSRTKAAQATINAFAKSYVKSVSKSRHGPYSDSESSSCEDQVEQAISHIHTRSVCLSMHKTKRGKGMHPEQNERGSDSSGPIL